MEGYGAATYGERIAGAYDSWHAGCEAACIDALAALAGAGRALELGIGTGRVAVPLQKRGVEVHGIDASPAMIEKLRERPGGPEIAVTLGDIADVPADGPFSLVYVVFNTFFCLPTQERQVRCFRRVAAHLAPGGAFLLEAFVPDVTRFRFNQATFATRVEEHGVMLDASRYDALNQQVLTQHVHLTESGVRLYPVKIRFAYPPELDLMARLAGMRLRERWSDWERSAFTAASEKHISVYERDG